MDPVNRKRTHSRQPLRETSGNVPSPNKRHKGAISANISTNENVSQQQQHQQPIPELNARVNLQPEKNGTLHGQSHQQLHLTQSQNQPQASKHQIQTRRSESRSAANNSNNSAAMGTKQDPKPRLSRLVGDELQEWRNNWRKIMKTSVVYFDTQGIDLSNPTHQLEQKRAQRCLKHVGSTLVPFYDKDVTIIVSKRPYNPTYNYSVNDIFHDVTPLKIKVWNFDKVFRFLKNLGVNDFDNLSNNPAESTGDLSNLLKEEKIFGSTDKDPNARREDLHYLDKNYLYVYDLSQNVRPIAIREWDNESYPTFHLTLDGKCPFLPDSDNSERKRLKRIKKFDDTQNYRNLLKKVAENLITNIKNRRVSLASLSSDEAQESPDNDSTISQGFNDTNSNADRAKTQQSDGETHSQSDGEFKENEFGDDKDDEINFELKFKHPKPSLSRNSSGIPTNNSNSRYYDVAASGFNGTSNAIQFSIDSGNFAGNGLGPTISQVPSKNINNLKRRIFMKKQKQISLEDKDKQRDLKPGYCENCRIKYDYFDDHITSNRHRRFALDDSNFADIDDLIETINENKSLGFVASDGDYSYSEN